MKPNALIIGAGKAGSTSLHNYLASHPNILGSKPKEVMYFTSKYENGSAWYESHFPETDGVDIYFESTPQYSFRDEFPYVASRVFNYNSDIKIIYIVRNPISRIISHFNHWSRVYPDRYVDLETSLSKEAHRKYFVDRTKYFYQIESYRKFFSDEQIKVVFLEDVQSSFEETLNDVFEFLGVSVLASSIPKKVHNRRPTVTTRIWTEADLTAERMREIQCYLKDDVVELLRYCGKPQDFWGPEFCK